MVDNKPAFVREQEFYHLNPGFQLQLRKMGDAVPLEKRKTIFISHTWATGLNANDTREFWIRIFVSNFAIHLKWLGFNVVLDGEDFSVNLHFHSNTLESVLKNTDHAILLVTPSYLTRTASVPDSGVAKELHVFRERSAKASQSPVSSSKDFIVLFSFVEKDKIPQFLLDEGAYISVIQLGYLTSLLNLSEKFYGLNVKDAEKIFVKPNCLLEQEKVCADSVLQLELKKMGDRVSSLKRKTIFISHAWALLPEEDHYYEQWTDVFVDNLAKHLEFIGFSVILDKKDLGIGVHKRAEMEKAVQQADHVLLIVTNTYLYKIKECPDAGVGIELSYIKDRIRLMGGGSVAGRNRFLLSFSLVNDLSGFPIIEGHGGYASVFINQVGYLKSLLELSHKLYGQEVNLQAAVNHFRSQNYFLNTEKRAETAPAVEQNKPIKSKL